MTNVCVAAFCIAPAYAQESDSAPASISANDPFDTDDSSVIVVTGSRVVRSGFTAPTPTTIINAESLDRRGSTNVADIISESPAFLATNNPQTTGVRSVTPGANFADLRGLGPTRTLVLVDGRRFTPQINALEGYVVDLNQIPALLLERAEVVTGGASAQWGSDAVAGVVNLILRKDFEGIKGVAQYGVSEIGDNEEYRIGGLFGTAFAGGRGHFTVAVDYVNNGGVGSTYTRDWGRKGYQITTNPVAGARPSNLILPDIQFSTVTPGGLINNTILRGTQFGPGGVTSPFVYGTYVGATNMVGGGNTGYNINTGVDMVPSVERVAAYGRASYEFSPAFVAAVEYSHAWAAGQHTTLPARDTAIRITRDNAFLPANIRQAMIDNNIETFNLGRIHYDLGTAFGDIRNTTDRAVLSFSGDLSTSGNWKWDGYYQYGKNVNRQTVRNNRIHANFALAVDAVFDGDRIVCNSTLTNPNNGCVPLNLFGAGSPSPEAAAYVMGTTEGRTDYTQHVVALNVSGDPVNTWAGPVSIATGIEYRSERQKTVADPISEAGGFEANNSRSFGGEFQVFEGYLETVVPLAADQPWARKFDVNGAVRVANYSTAAGTQVTWKVGAVYEPTDGLMFRLARSRDIRAPSIYELNLLSVPNSIILNYSPHQVQVTTYLSGNPNLQPEKADTLTVGASYQPSFVRGLRLSLDYYNIKVRDLVSSLGTQAVADACRTGQTAYCSFLTFDADGVPLTALSTYVNLASVKLQGFDFALNYAMPIGSDASFYVNALVNYNLHAKVNPGTGVVVDRAGEIGSKRAVGLSTGGSPKLRFTLSTGVELGAFNIGTQLRYIGKGTYNNEWTSGVQINDNDIGAVVYADLTAGYKINETIELFGAINNLFDKDPPPVPNAQSLATNPVYYDMIGRSYRIGARVNF
ncbi:MAG TPA: TonB-dependent receptor [Sphingomonadaceae bacterium]|nr:TonB-dependent receptor [Sphingomonadaceae bacterium]